MKNIKDSLPLPRLASSSKLPSSTVLKDSLPESLKEEMESICLSTLNKCAQKIKVLTEYDRMMPDKHLPKCLSVTTKAETGQIITVTLEIK